MGISRQIPWRKVKVVAVIGVILVLAHSLWSSAISRYQPSVKFTNDDIDSGLPAMDEFTFTRPDFAARAVNPEKLEKQDIPHVKVHDDRPLDKPQVVGANERNTCDKIIPFGDFNDGRISTYDLPAETDYSLAADGRYKIPEEFYKTDTNPPEEEINVILVPFSHTDPGYGRTVEQYYYSMTKNVLNNMVTFLSRTPDMTFQWAETVFLERWFRDIDDATKQKVRELVANGQLEIVLGGWVMPDEAITHYLPVVDQLIEGHQWLLENLGVAPTDAWVNDPFGFSSTMPYLWKSSGIDNLVILRIHQAVKATLMKKRSLDFMWRPYWNSLRDDDILCNLMPYQNYWNSDVCGPDPNVCKKFNFLHMIYGNGAVPITDSNVGSLATELYNAYRFTASMFQYNNIVIFLGEDNSYDNMLSWQDTYTNYQKLASFINSKSEWKMHIKFGTIREYFENIRTAEAHSKDTMKFPVLSGDFFPYSDKEDDYWTGYFTTRPWMKRFTREIEPMIRAADRFSVILYFHCVVRGACRDIKDTHKQILRDLRDARREVGIYQHHDGITGTSLPFVVDDYEKRLLKAFQCTKNALALSVVTILTHGNVNNARALVDNNVKTMAQDLLGPNVHKFNQDELKIIVANSLEKARIGTVSFYIEKREIGSVSNVLSYQISEADSPKYQNYLLLTLLVELSPFELKIVEIRTKQTDGTNLSPYIEEIARPKSSSDEVISIENKFMKVEFYTKSGSLKCIFDKRGRYLNISSTFMKYKPQKSGAYLFGPAGPAEEIGTLLDPQVKISTGPVFSQVVLEFKPGFTQKWTLYHTDGIKGRGLHLTQDISLRTHPSFVETELILRLKTDINSGNIFYTDQNGFQLMGRQNNQSTPIERNYYPITSMVLIEDIERRLTLHSAQSHGVASLEKGWLEVMLDRNMAHDDQKGLGMGATERIPTLTEFIIQIEYNNEAVEKQEPRYTHASIESNLLNEQLQNKLEAFSIAFEAEKFQEGFHIPEKFVQFPCDTSIVSLRSLVTNDLQINGTSFVLHRKPKHCSFPVNVASCSMTNDPVNFLNFNFGLDSEHLSGNVSETSLSHVHSLGKIQVSDDLRPGINELRSFLIKT